MPSVYDNEGYRKSNLHNFTPKKFINSNYIDTNNMSVPAVNANGIILYNNTGTHQIPGNNGVWEKPLMQKGGRTPIIVNNKNDIRLKKYTDSLSLYNKGLLNKNNIINPVSSLVDKENYDDIIGQLLENDRTEAYNDYKKTGILPDRQYFGAFKNGLPGSYEYGYKKPVQPIIYKPAENIFNYKGQKMPESDYNQFKNWAERVNKTKGENNIDKKTIEPMLKLFKKYNVPNEQTPAPGLPGIMNDNWSFGASDLNSIKKWNEKVKQPIIKEILADPEQYKSHGSIQITSPQQSFYEMVGNQPIYGPSGALIGMGNGQSFSPDLMNTAGRKKANQADIDLLANPEELKKYIEKKGYNKINSEYQKGGRVPIIVNDRNDPRLKAYNDSLEVRTRFDQNFVKGWKTRPLTNKEETQWKDDKTGLVPNVVEYNKLAYDKPGNLTSGSHWYYGHFKKPVQPVIYSPEVLADPAQYKTQVKGTITSPQPSYYNMEGNNPVYGPSGSLIGMGGDNGNFSPDYMNTAARKNVNQLDIDLLNNPEALKKYIQAKGYNGKTQTYQMGGGIGNINPYMFGNPSIDGSSPQYLSNPNPYIQPNQFISFDRPKNCRDASGNPIPCDEVPPQEYTNNNSNTNQKSQYSYSRQPFGNLNMPNFLAINALNIGAQSIANNVDANRQQSYMDEQYGKSLYSNLAPISGQSYGVKYGYNKYGGQLLSKKKFQQGGDIANNEENDEFDPINFLGLLEDTKNDEGEKSTILSTSDIEDAEEKAEMERQAKRRMNYMQGLQSLSFAPMSFTHPSSFSPTSLNESIAQGESGGNYFAANPQPGQSAFGKYQFTNAAQKDAYNQTNGKEKFGSFAAYQNAFKTNPAVQEEAMQARTQQAKKIVGNDRAALALYHYAPKFGIMYKNGELDLDKNPAAYGVGKGVSNPTFRSFLKTHGFKNQF